MDWYNLVFYHVFKRYYKNGNYKNDIPWLTATGILSVSTFFFLTGIFVVFYYFFINKNIPQLNNLYTIFGIIFTVLNCLWFTYKNRYLSIYKHYQALTTNNRKTEILSWLYIILGFASVPFVAIFVRQ
jgi:hypothetical protein